MRIMSLNEMLTELRHEARLSNDVSHGSHLQDRHIALLRRVQEEVYDDFDWPMLNITATVNLGVGQRTATYPTQLALDTITRVWAKTDGDDDWRGLHYGIGVEHLNHKDSEADERDTDVLRWQHYLADGAETVNTTMFEVWPIPSTPCTLRFEGQRKLGPLVNPDTDSSTIDGPSVVLHAAAEILAGAKAEDAQFKLQKAQARIQRIRQAQSTPDTRRASMFPGGNASVTARPYRFRTPD